MTLEEIEILKEAVQREHRSDVIRVLEEMERIEKSREKDRLALGESAAQRDFRERVEARAKEMMKRVYDRAISQFDDEGN